MQKTLSFIYLLLLCISAGGILALGAFSAPMIFHHESTLGMKLLSRYEAGLIMSQIFVNFGYQLGFTLLFASVYNGYRYFKDESRRIAALSISLVALIAGAIFIFYLTPQIIYMQQLGESGVMTPQFESLHKASEMTFKLLFVLLIALAYIHFVKVSSEQK